MKRICTIILLFAIIINTVFSTAVFAKEDNFPGKIQYLVDKKIVQGDEKANLNLDDKLKRSELTKIITYALGYENKANLLKNTKSKFNDIDIDHWANGVIQAASTIKMKNGGSLIHGYPDNTFKPDKYIKNIEAIKIMVVAFKDDLTLEQLENARWPDDFIKWAEEERLIGKGTGVENIDPNKEMTRKDAFVCLYNGLIKTEAKIKEQDNLNKLRGEMKKIHRPINIRHSNGNDIESRFNNVTPALSKKENLNLVKPGKSDNKLFEIKLLTDDKIIFKTYTQDEKDLITKAKEGDKVYIRLNKLDDKKVIDTWVVKSGNKNIEVKKDDKDSYFIMPKGDVEISVKLKDNLDRPETEEDTSKLGDWVSISIREYEFAKKKNINSERFKVVIEPRGEVSSSSL